MQKYVDVKALGTKLQIISAFAVEHVKGFIYIEAVKQNDINEVHLTTLMFFFPMFYLGGDMYRQCYITKLSFTCFLYAHLHICYFIRHAKVFAIYIQVEWPLFKCLKFHIYSLFEANTVRYL